MVLTHSKRFMNGLGIRMHARLTAAETGDYSYMSEVILQVENNIFEIQSNDALVFLNGENYTVQDVDDQDFPFKLTRAVRGQRKNMIEYTFDFLNGSSITIRANIHFKMVFVDVKGNFHGEDLQGLLGSPRKKGLFGRNGQDMEADINGYGQDWQVTESEPKLFMAANREPQAPTKCTIVVDGGIGHTGVAAPQLRGRRRLLELEDGTMVDRTAAAQDACSHVSSGGMRQYCIDDVIATGNIELADDPFYK